MESKVAKHKIKNATKRASLRCSSDFKKNAKILLKQINEKDTGRKVKIDALLDMALSLVEPRHLKMLQEKSLTNQDRKERLRQKYIEIRGYISEDDFTGFMMSGDFSAFMAEHGDLNV